MRGKAPPPVDPRRYLRVGLSSVVVFVVAGLVAPLYSSEEFDFWLTLWQAVILWPIGAVLLWLPVWILTDHVPDRRLSRFGQAVLAGVAIWGMVAVARSDDAQAGLYWLVIPMYGTLAMVALAVIQWLYRRRSG